MRGCAVTCQRASLELQNFPALGLINLGPTLPTTDHVLPPLGGDTPIDYMLCFCPGA